MGGIKNHIQSYGVMPGSQFSNIEDPIERHQAFMAQEVTPYCKGCGKQILDANEDEVGSQVNYQAEQERRMCTKCYNEQVEKFRKLHAEQVAREAENAKQEQEVNWEELKQKYSRE